MSATQDESKYLTGAERATNPCVGWPAGPNLDSTQLAETEPLTSIGGKKTGDIHVTARPKPYDLDAPHEGGVFRHLRLVREPARKRTLYERVFKRPLDLAIAIPLTLGLSPIIATVAVAVRIRLGGPVLYRQQRVGRDGAPFTILKFRTMMPDRRGIAVAYDDDDTSFEGPDRRNTHKTRNDPRHTSFGTFLRRYALDELPQLFNVLRGDMSMVGPRPEILGVAEDHGIVDHIRHSVRPGITGPWQLSGDRSKFISESLEHDEQYVEKLTFRSDWSMLVKTVAHFRQGNGE